MNFDPRDVVLEPGKPCPCCGASRFTADGRDTYPRENLYVTRYELPPPLPEGEDDEEELCRCAALDELDRLRALLKVLYEEAALAEAEWAIVRIDEHEAATLHKQGV